MVPKAFKEVKQQVDIVGKGRGDHGDSSWKGFAVFSRRTCHYRLCQVIYAHPSVRYFCAAEKQKGVADAMIKAEEGLLELSMLTTMEIQIGHTCYQQIPQPREVGRKA